MNQQELLAYLQKEAETAQAKVSVLWKDMDADQELYAFAPDREMVSASTIKVLILLGGPWSGCAKAGKRWTALWKFPPPSSWRTPPSMNTARPRTRWTICCAG